MKDVDEYIQLNYSNYCDVLLLGFTFVNEKLSVRYWIYVTAVILTSVMNIKDENELRFFFFFQVFFYSKWKS